MNQPNTAKQWSPCDLEFEADQAHAWNTFPAQVTFANSDTEIVVDAYWDGAQTWRARFAPTLPGTWEWRSASADPGLDGKSGSLVCAPPSAAEIEANPNCRGHLTTSGNGHCFTYADGTPFLYLGDTCWHMNEKRCGLGENEDGPFFTWLRDRKRKGFTVINHWLYASGHPKRNEEFISSNEGGDAWGATADGKHDFQALNPAYYRFVDLRWRALWANGFVMAGPPTWFAKPDHHMTLEQAQDFSRYVMARYGAFNMVWALSGEYSFGPQSKHDPWDRTETWNALGAFVAAHNPYAHPVSIHPGPAVFHASSSEEFHDSGWLDHNWLQTGQYAKGLYRVATCAKADYDKTPTRPTLQAEGFYEGQPEAGGAVSAQTRFQPWVAFLNGACGAVYGACGIWPFSAPSDPKSYSYKGNLDWRTALQLPGSAHIRHIADFLRGMAWWEWVPQREKLLVNGQPAPMPTEDDYSPPHAAGIPGKNLVVYIPTGNANNAIALSELPAPSCTAQWYDPRQGTFTAIEKPLVADGDDRYPLPPRPAPADEDWVCVIRVA
ncbi:MAG: DUF4038 domain-containing protein [Kiritimatiellae bacterium]|nr:DUF4038 domain-containing protein [Kiritimatiellia bacterium]